MGGIAELDTSISFEELAQIKAPLVSFTDDLFTYDMDRVGRICDLILARGIRKRYFD